VTFDRATPEGYHTVTPRIVVDDVAGFVAFLRVVFGATGDIVEGRPAEIRVGDSLVMVTPVGDRELFPLSSTFTSLTQTSRIDVLSMPAPKPWKRRRLRRTATGVRWSRTRSATSFRSRIG
jgi:hypothetical protein